MSSTVRSYGYMALLINAITDEDKLEELQDEMWDGNSGLFLNGNGTMLYSDLNASKSYSEREDIYGLFIGSPSIEQTKEHFTALALAEGFEVDVATIKPYNCIWYNGSDSPMILTTPDEFKKHNS